MHNIIILIFLLCSTSIRVYSQNPTFNPEKTAKEIDSLKESVLVETLQKWENTYDYYFDLRLAGGFSEEPHNKFRENELDTVLFRSNNDSTISEIRYSVNRDTVAKYVNIYHMDTLLVLNNKLDVIDELVLSNFETYLKTGKHYFVGDIATYRSKSKMDYTGYIVISKNGSKLLSKKNILTFKKNERYTKRIIALNNFPSDSIFSSGYFTYKGDTISHISFFDKVLVTNNLYLLRNGKPMDAIVQEKAVNEVILLPLEKNNVIHFLAKTYGKFDIDGTEYTYNSSTPIGIDLSNFKFIRHISNRIKL